MVTKTTVKKRKNKREKGMGDPSPQLLNKGPKAARSWAR
jgi:hypothetical protein